MAWIKMIKGFSELDLDVNATNFPNFAYYSSSTYSDVYGFYPSTNTSYNPIASTSNSHEKLVLANEILTFPTGTGTSSNVTDCPGIYNSYFKDKSYDQYHVYFIDSSGTTRGARITTGLFNRRGYRYLEFKLFVNQWSEHHKLSFFIANAETTTLAGPAAANKYQIAEYLNGPGGENQVSIIGQVDINTFFPNADNIALYVYFDWSNTGGTHNILKFFDFKLTNSLQNYSL